MLVASVLSELSDAITSVVGDYGLYAVFWLMFIDAVLPAASELVMVYGGAIAAGAFADQEVTLFGRTIDEGLARLLRHRAGGDDRLHARLDDGLGDRATTAGARTSSATAAGST